MDDKLYDSSVDFMSIRVRYGRTGIEISPDFEVRETRDLMIRGGDFYAVWLEDKKRWSTNEYDVVRLVDKELKKFMSDHSHEFGYNVSVKFMRYASSGSINMWHKYVKEQMRDTYSTLNQTLVFADTEPRRELYSSVSLPYKLEAGPIDAYDTIMSTLYEPEERMKIEWCIGAVMSGEASKTHKFLVLYGAHGTGKSTVLHIIEKLFEGYRTSFMSKTLGNSSTQFPFSAFANDPLVAIEHEGDLSRIEDNTRLNSLTAHEEVLVNTKYKTEYTAAFKVFLFIATNKHVKITDAKSGIIRRLIDASPSGRKIPASKFRELESRIDNELGAIAEHCRQVYLRNRRAYDDYIPTAMLYATNDFYNYVVESWDILDNPDGISIKTAWELYQKYCDDAKVPHPMSSRAFNDEIKNYFKEFHERWRLPDGTRVRSYLTGFDMSKFENKDKPADDIPKEPVTAFSDFAERASKLDIYCASDPAQYANANETPIKAWANVETTLSDIDTSKLHYLKPKNTNLIFIDFDLKDDSGKKSFARNLEAASKFPETYAELSKGGQGIHLYYIYDGDPATLSHVFSEHIEIKTTLGGSSIRRRLSKCNDLPIAKLSGYLPVKGEAMIDETAINNEKHLQALIEKALRKQISPGSTRCCIDFIRHVLDEAYDSGMVYDLRRMYNVVVNFAAHSTNSQDYCMRQIPKMKFCSADALDDRAVLEETQPTPDDNGPLYILDCEVFPNLFIVCWGPLDTDEVYAMVNPSPDDIRELCKLRFAGFNNRKYDNHILYGRMLGYSNLDLYKLSLSIIGKRGGQSAALFKNAYNLSETDILDFSSEKKSLKKWEIQLRLPHKECPFPWDQDVDPKNWPIVVEYCKNDVQATKAVFKARKTDFMARQIQVDIVKQLHGIHATVNDTTNSLSAKIVFGKEQHPQREFNYRDLSKPVGWTEYTKYRQLFGKDYVFHIFDADGLPTYDIYDGDHGVVALPDGWSILPFFPGYKFENGVSTYLGSTIGEGGKVYGRPGMYGDVWDGDVTSMHPHSAIAEVAFGPKYTKVLKDLVDARVAIKNKDFKAASKMLNGVLTPYLKPENAKGLAQALKIVINSIYGLTSAKFENKFRDPRNVDNIIAKRGALFMTLLKQEVEKRGFTVAHIKTDSIKIPNATPEIREFVLKFGLEYGYTFTTEYDFDRYCLVNDAVYIARVKDGDEAGQWVAIGDQFKVPYVFKTLFSKEDIEFNDLCETFNVNSSLWLDMNEDLEDPTPLLKELARLEKKGLNIERQEAIKQHLESCHDYRFIGRIGLFCPVKPGFGGGVLCRLDDKSGKMNSAGGAKGYRWLEADQAEPVYRDIVDYSYYNRLVDDAVDAISSFGDFEWFVSDSKDPMPVDFPVDDDVPF